MQHEQNSKLRKSIYHLARLMGVAGTDTQWAFLFSLFCTWALSSPTAVKLSRLEYYSSLALRMGSHTRLQSTLDCAVSMISDLMGRRPVANCGVRSNLLLRRERARAREGERRAYTAQVFTFPAKSCRLNSTAHYTFICMLGHKHRCEDSAPLSCGQGSSAVPLRRAAVD